MTTNRIIVKHSATMEIEHYDDSDIVTIYVDNPDNLCMDNAYNGDHATIDLSIEDAKELHAYLTEILKVRGALQ